MDHELSVAKVRTKSGIISNAITWECLTTCLLIGGVGGMGWEFEDMRLMISWLFGWNWSLADNGNGSSYIKCSRILTWQGVERKMVLNSKSSSKLRLPQRLSVFYYHLFSIYSKSNYVKFDRLYVWKNSKHRTQGDKKGKASMLA